MIQPRWIANSANTVVLVEDHPELAAYLAERLSEYAQVTVFANAEAALAHIGTHGCAVLISDIGLSGMSGIELCRRVKDDQTLSATPVILISALSSDANRQAAREAGATAFLGKPFSLEALLESMDQACSREQPG